jgi:hypothetical protein
MKQNETNLGEKGEKREEKYCCKICDYNTSVKFSYDRHILTSKHIKMVQNVKNETNETKKEKKEKKENVTCECGEVYYSRTTLWRHKKICGLTKNLVVQSDKTDKKDELIDYLMKENKEIKELILELSKKDSYNNCNNTVNSHNKTFNLQFFLNETCKDAMNIMDFVDSIKLQLSDLEGVGELGYVEGISNIIVKNLKELDITQRPVHCTDKKRETMYIKDEDKWEKDEEKKKLHKVVRKVTCKNQNLIPAFKEKHPDCNTYHSKFSDQYNKIIIESMGGKGDNDYEKEEKIIKNISKQVFIDKEQVS